MTVTDTEQKIFGVGLSRTGTSSLAEALEILGIRTIHYPHDAVTHTELRDGRYRLSVLKTHQAALDTPVAAFYPQLDQEYPGSQFILTLRDRESWLRSCEAFWSAAPAASGADDDFRAFIRTALYGCVDFQPERFAEVFDRHTRTVLDYFSHRPGQLLVMDIIAGDGWEVLCPFLGREIPEVRFPHLNDSVRNEEWHRARRLALDELAAAVPNDARCILVDEQSFGPVGESGISVLPFLERDGRYWGRPSDDAEAMAELERLRAEGARYLAFVWPTFWWLDHYTGFSSYLRQHCTPVTETDRITVFALRTERSAS